MPTRDPSPPAPLARIPVATYRLQFNRHFTLREAAALVPYLAELGISDPYASPLLAARAGSLHGYDVVDPSRLNPELGTDEDLEAFARELRARGMGLLLDIVPNHMCVADPSNRWWADVLENGPSSPYARYFDIDWHPPKTELADKVLLPFLGDQYGRVLENQELRIVFQGGAFLVEVYDKLLPLAPRSWRRLLEPALGALRRTLPEADPHRMELESILTALEYLPGREETAPEKVRERTREKEVIRRRLAALVEASPDVRAALERSLEDVNGRGDPRSFDRLEALLEDQAYRLCFWQVATDEINYRRFFDLNELAAIRVEDPEVFEAVHGTVLEYVRRGWVTGLRIDHVDGLYDPLAYLRSLQGAAARALGAPEDPGRLPLYVVVEKILMRDERLSPDWPVHGTTGYDFLNVLNGLFVDPLGAEALGDFYRRFAGGAADVREALATCKKFIMHVSMASELFMLACRLDAISEQHRWSRDFTRESQRFALREVTAWFPVYRTYIRGDGEAWTAATCGRRSSKRGGGAPPRARPSSSSSGRCGSWSIPTASPKPRGRSAASSSCASSSSPAPSWPRGSKTPSSTGTSRWPPPTRWGPSRGAFPRLSRNSTPATPSGSSPGRTRSWPPPPTTPSAARTSGPASTSSRKCPARGPRRRSGGAA